MNIIQQQDALKNLPDQYLQKELLNPTGAAPSYLVLTELQRRKDMRASFSAMQGGNPNSTIAEEFAKGLGSAEVGQYGEAVRGSMPGSSPAGDQPSLLNAPQPPQGMTSNQPSPIGQAPQQPQAFAAGGGVEMAPMAPMATMATMAGGRPQFNQGLMGIPSAFGQGMGAPGQMDFLAALASGLGGSGDANGPGGAEGNGPGGGVGTSAGDAAASAAAGVGVGASDAGVGTGTGDTYARGGYVRRYADGGDVSSDVPESWLYPSRARFLRSIGRPDIQRSSDPRFPTLGLPMDEPPLGSVPEYEAPPRVRMGVTGKPYPGPGPGQPQGLGWDDFSKDPDTTLGESIARRVQGRGLAAAAPYDEPPPPLTGREFAEPLMAAGIDNTGQNDPSPPPVGASRQGNYGDSYGTDPRIPPSGGRPVRQGAGGGGGARGPASAGGGGGGGGRSGGAGSGLNQGIADFVGDVRGLQAADRFSEIERQNQLDKAKLLEGMESDKGMALLQAGLGIAAGTSPWAVTNIGQGAQAGVKYWQDAKKEMRVAEQGIRQADNAIAVARANRDERQLEMAVKTKMHFEEMRERVAARQAASGDAAENRRLAREDRALDREEGRILKDTQLAITDVNSITAEIKVLQRSLDSLTLDEPTRKSYESEMADKRAELRTARARLGKLQGVRDDKTGVGAALNDTKPKVYGTYVPGKGIVPQ